MKIDWNEFLSKENITESEWAQADELSNKWVTCAVGNQCRLIPKTMHGEPIDSKLFNLGLKFSVLIARKNIEDIKFCLKQIEKRSDEIINEIKQNEK